MVEVGGSSHDNKAAYDAKRDTYLELTLIDDRKECADSSNAKTANPIRQNSAILFRNVHSDVFL